MGDDQIVISSGQVITPETVLSRGFSSAFRGYHPAEVREFLRRVSDEMAAGAGREVELRRALQEALARAAHPELDEATVTNVLGDHAARLLAGARDTAASLTAEAEAHANAALRDAETRIARMREEAEGLMARRVAEADAAAASIRHAAEAEVEALRNRAKAEAEEVVEAAKRQGRDMVGEARDVRERMLGDLARRRRSAQMQVEQLRAARDRLLAAYDVVRRTVEEATAELDAAEPEARMAAEAVARRSEETDVAMAVAAEEAALHREPRAEPWSTSLPPTEPERAMSLVPGSRTPAVREQREAPVPASALYRRLEDSRPLPPDRPPLRPQTVADVSAARSTPAAPPPVPLPPSAPPSELATGEVPAVTAGPPNAKADPLGAEPVPPGGEGGGEGRTVEELFARIRADRAHGDPGEPPSATSHSNGSPVAPDSPPPPDAIAGESAFQGRDHLIENLEAGLTRALKRILQDEQNEVLDILRRLGATAGAAVLPEHDAQVASYSDAALPWLQQAARAGAGFVTDPAPGEDVEEGHPALAAQARSLALELVEPLRERLSRAVAGGAEADDPSVVAESLRATYRQWKVQQVEECARHHALTAFSVGAYAATPDVAALQWLVDDDGHCPDCDDNALAGPTGKGQSFPTGQLHPPAHPGCRCLLLPVTT